MKYRIKEQYGKFHPQYRKFFIWRYFNYWDIFKSTYLNSSFDDIEKAKEFISDVKEEKIEKKSKYHYDI